LGDLIRQAAEIIANRTELSISAQIEAQDPAPPDVHFALYRVVQEALNNVVMHASASHVEIFFNSQSGRIDLSIQDDGLGFDPADVDAGHLGLSIMSDRIQNIGGTLETISRKGGGTLIKIAWTAPIS
jgi:signal transduction histidine kinase